MLTKTLIQQVISSQLQKIKRQGASLTRGILSGLPVLRTHALIISGVRRCGKSTLLLQLLAKTKARTLYLNFDDPRLFGFELTDFQLLDALIAEARAKVLLFDELQIISGWEMYARQKLDEGFRVIVTGSNASLLSRELGTRLTGRHITKELFPFSYKEFLAFSGSQAGASSWQKYQELGGFPEYLKTRNSDILTALFTDILNRDIAVRHGVRDIRSLQKLAVYLVSNAGNLVTAGRLRQTLGFKTSATVLEYFSFLQDTYLVDFLPKFSYSLKAQAVNPRKVYIIDSGLIQTVSASFTDDRGRLLENLIYWQLRRSGQELYYFQDNGAESDFVALNKGRPKQIIQVCYELNVENRGREQKGLHAALDFFKTAKGIIITANQKDVYLYRGKPIQIVPAWEFCQRD